MSKEEIESTKYNEQEIKKLLIFKNNKDTEIKVLKLLPFYFSERERYTKEYIKFMLQKIYDETGFQKTATAEQLSTWGWYETKPCKVKNKQGNYENGFEIQRMQFNLLASTK